MWVFRSAVVRSILETMQGWPKRDTWVGEEKLKTRTDLTPRLRLFWRRTQSSGDISGGSRGVCAVAVGEGSCFNNTSHLIQNTISILELNVKHRTSKINTGKKILQDPKLSKNVLQLFTVKLRIDTTPAAGPHHLSSSTWHHLESSGKSLGEGLSRSSWHVTVSVLVLITLTEAGRPTHSGQHRSLGRGSWTVWVQRWDRAQISIHSSLPSIMDVMTSCLKFLPSGPPHNNGP